MDPLLSNLITIGLASLSFVGLLALGTLLCHTQIRFRRTALKPARSTGGAE
jgi:hypothetical protein